MKSLPKELEKRIEKVIAMRFYNLVTPYNVIRWLFNFDDEDVELAIQLLEHVVFLRDNDIKKRLKDSFQSLPSNKTKHIVPLGEPGKSGAAVSYWIHGMFKNKGRYYSDLERFLDYRNSEEWNPKKNIVVFVDDIVGSGGSVISALSVDDKLRSEVLQEAKNGNVFIVAAVIMRDGRDYVKSKLPGVNVVGDVQCKGFDPHEKLFGSYFKTKNVREMCYKYGIQLYKEYPLGYENTQCLVLMQHSSPNNSIPVLWSNNEYNGKEWNPLVPRNNLLKVQRAYSDRNTVRKWLVCLKELFFAPDNDIDLKFIFTKEHLNLVFILICLLKKKSEAVIVNAMGISCAEMDILWQEGIKKKIWDKQHKPTKFAVKRYSEAVRMSHILDDNGKKRDDTNFDERNYIYIPETFKGVK